MVTVASPCGLNYIVSVPYDCTIGSVGRTVIHCLCSTREYKYGCITDAFGPVTVRLRDLYYGYHTSRTYRYSEQVLHRIPRTKCPSNESSPNICLGQMDFAMRRKHSVAKPLDLPPSIVLLTGHSNTFPSDVMKYRIDLFGAW